MSFHAFEMTDSYQGITPSKDEYVRLARDATLIPVYQEMIADAETPVSALSKLGDGPYRFILESVEGGNRLGRYSFVGNTATCVFKSTGSKVEVGRRAVRPDKTDADMTWTTYEATNPLEVLRSLLNEYRAADMKGLPRFYGGAVGYLGYDLVQGIYNFKSKATDVLQLPDSYLIFSDIVLIFDHVQGTLKVVVNTVPGSDPDAAYDDAVHRIGQVLRRLQNGRGVGHLQTTDRTETPTLNFSTNFSREQFEQAVVQCKEYIHAGEASQIVLSQRFSTPIKAKPITLYRVLRTVNPSPYMYYLQFDDVAIVGSSPEVMVRVEDGTVSLRPIAGTRPRGQTEDDDLRLEQELLADEKECAEHMMLLKLGQEDLERICAPDTVSVDSLMTIERYSHVMHIVSNISGKLSDQHDAIDVLQSTFPAGTVSGAPRKRAIEIIDQLEGERRGPYAGAIGYFGYSGNMDSCITIRTAVIKDGFAYIQAGAGIVADSVPEREYQETINKAKAMLKAIAIAEGV